MNLVCRNVMRLSASLRNGKPNQEVLQVLLRETPGHFSSKTEELKASSIDPFLHRSSSGITLKSEPIHSSIGVQTSSKLCYSTVSFNDAVDDGDNNADIEDDNLMPEKRELEPQGVDPRRGWGFRGVHKAIICGKIGQAPVQKILRNGRTVTIFTVGTGGMFDQRIIGSENLPRPAQWHRIAVHDEQLGAYSVQQLVKNSPVFVEGDIETRVYNDSINGQVKNIPEICVRRDGKIRLIKTGESVGNISLDDLREGLF